MVRITNSLRIYEWCPDVSGQIRNHSLFAQHIKYLFASTLLILCFQSTYAQQQVYKNYNEGDTIAVNKNIYTIHRYQKGETVYSIAAKYHVSVNDLDKANKDVVNNLKKNTVLLIPVSKSNEEVKKEEVKKASPKDSIYKIALLIPFNESKNYTVDSTLANGYALNGSLERETINNLEFYEGVLTAIDSLKANGLKVHVSVIDAYDSASVQSAKLKPEVKNADVIVMNINQNLAGLLSYYSVNGKPLLVSCAANSSVSLKGNKDACFTSPSSLLQCRQMAEYYIKRSNAKDRFLIIKTAFSKEIERADAFNSGLSDGKDSIDKVVLDTTTNPSKSLSSHLVKGKNNIVFLPSTNEAYVSDVINYLKMHTAEFEITLAGLPTWPYFESVNPEDLQLLHTQIFSAVNIAYASTAVVAFRKAFRDKYSTEPSENAFAGYDAMMFLGKQLINYGADFSDHVVDKYYPELSTVFHLVKENDGNGFENNYISVLQFEGYELKKLNGK